MYDLQVSQTRIIKCSVNYFITNYIVVAVAAAAVAAAAAAAFEISQNFNSSSQLNTIAKVIIIKC